MASKDFFERGNYYHVYNHGNGADMIFKSEENYSFFLRKEQEYMNEAWDLLCWCQMPNHYHLLVRIKDDFPGIETEEEINKKVYYSFSHFTNGYAKAFNKQYKRRGSLFVKTFNRKRITDDKYLLTIIRYIHLNPVNHGFTSLPEKWKHSSYNSALLDFRKKKKTELTSIFANEEEFVNLHSR